jgi:hypothetical protein
LEQLKNNQLFPKRSKCSFCKRQVEYLGHIISKKEVTIDPKKTEAVKDWPVPSAIKELRGFLSLAGYYRKFIQGFGMLIGLRYQIHYKKGKENVTTDALSRIFEEE